MKKLLFGMFVFFQILNCYYGACVAQIWGKNEAVESKFITIIFIIAAACFPACVFSFEAAHSIGKSDNS